MNKATTPATVAGLGPHITAFYAENVKKLRAVRIRPDGTLVQICGPNGSGKSSVLDAIWWALGGTTDIDAVPIRRGADRAVIQLTLGDVTVTRKFTPNGSTLTLTSASGAEFKKPQQLLDQLIGALTFDPLAFERMSAKERLSALRAIAPLPPDVDRLEAEIATAFEQRTSVNRMEKQLRGELEGLPRPDAAVLALPPLDASALIAQLATAGEHNTRIGAEIAYRDRTAREIDLQREAARVRRAEAERLLAEAADIEARADKAVADLAALPPLEPLIHTETLRAEVATAHERMNTQTAERAKLARLEEVRDKLDRVVDAATTLTEEIAAMTAQRTALIAAAPMPVEGLSYGDGDVLFGGQPFDQASAAERIRVAMAIAMAGNPQVRIVRIKDGSLLDARSLALVAEMAAAQGFQVWVERVDTSGTVGIVMEDGEVVEPAEAVATLQEV